MAGLKALCVLAFALGLSAKEQQNKHPVNQVVVLTQGRSGSTFVGELVSKIPGALYLYEPCRSLTMTIDENEVTKFSKVDEGACQAFVGRLLDCSITTDDAEKLFMDWVAITKCNVRAVCMWRKPNERIILATINQTNTMCLK